LCLCFDETLAAALASANRLTLVILLNEAGLLDCGYNFLAQIAAKAVPTAFTPATIAGVPLLKEVRLIIGLLL
jgi:hypothetical protein